MNDWPTYLQFKTVSIRSHQLNIVDGNISSIPMDSLDNLGLQTDSLC